MTMPFQHAQRRHQGFSLVEIMIAMTILAIVAAAAIPSYAEFGRKSARADAQLILLQAANDLERIYLQCNSYDKLYNKDIEPPDNPCESSASEIRNKLLAKYPQIPQTGTARYSLVADLSADTYTLTAVRAPNSPQSQDVCGDLTLTQTGIRGVKNQASGMAVTDCWRR